MAQFARPGLAPVTRHNLGAAVAVWRAVALITRVTEESMLVVREVGVQLERRTHFGRSKTRFIPRERLLELVLSEGIHCHQFVFYLAFIVEGERRMVLPFEVCCFPMVLRSGGGGCGGLIFWLKVTTRCGHFDFTVCRVTRPPCPSRNPPPWSLATRTSSRDCTW